MKECSLREVKKGTRREWWQTEGTASAKKYREAKMTEKGTREYKYSSCPRYEEW